MSSIYQVAERAGVSATTVSHVVNNTRTVSAAVRARVQQAMVELDYRPNGLARSLRRGQTHTLGLILPDSANPFFAGIARAIENAAFQIGLSVILGNTEGNCARERYYVDLFTQKRVDGIIFVNAGDRAESLVHLVKRGVPAVVVDRDLPGLEIDAVLTDNRGGGYLATRHLLGLGHRRIGCIAGPSTVTPSALRVEGYRAALAEADLPIDSALTQVGDFHPESGRLATHALLGLPTPPTAIFAGNDLMAIGALRAAAECGRHVPTDLAVVGFDDIELAAYTLPPLSTIAQPRLAIGQAAVRLLIERIADRSLAARRELLPTQLVVRASCAAAPRGPGEVADAGG